MIIRSLAVFTLFAVSSCMTPPPQIEDQMHREPDLITVNPNDIAVLPVEDASIGSKAAGVTEFIRERIRSGLVSRNYVPLGTIYVDANLRQKAPPGVGVVEASFLESIAKTATDAKVDGMLAVRIKRWDETKLYLNRRVAFHAEAVLFGSRDPKILWRCDLRGEVVAGGGKAPPQDPNAWPQAAAIEFVKELMGRLPARQN